MDHLYTDFEFFYCEETENPTESPSQPPTFMNCPVLEINQCDFTSADGTPFADGIYSREEVTEDKRNVFGTVNGYSQWSAA